MKAPARGFRLSDWYGDDWDHKKPLDDDLWVSPWAKAHYKIRQQEIEIEQCEFLMQQAVEIEDYAEADGLKQRVERLRAQHPIQPREQRLTEALEDGNFALAAIFQQDLDSVKKNLGLPQYGVGQAVVHAHREGLRGVIMDVDLTCTKSRQWVEDAGCLERGCALDYPSREMDVSALKSWVNQPFYTVLIDLDDMRDDEAAASGRWRWRWPQELAAWETNHRAATPAPLYLPEDALLPDSSADAKTPRHPELSTLFGEHETTPHRGRLYRASPRLRLWQQERAKQLDAARRRQRAGNLNAKKVNPYSEMGATRG